MYNRSSGGRFVQVSLRAKEQHELYSSGGEWRLAVYGEKLAYISTKTGGPTPPLDGWVVPPHKAGAAPVVGVAPAPHLVVTP